MSSLDEMRELAVKLSRRITELQEENNTLRQRNREMSELMAREHRDAFRLITAFVVQNGGTFRLQKRVLEIVGDDTRLTRWEDHDTTETVFQANV